MFSGNPTKIGYDYSTGFNGVMMDVEVYSSENQQENNSSTALGPSNAGCTSDFGTWALAVLILLFVPTSKTKITKQPQGKETGRLNRQNSVLFFCINIRYSIRVFEVSIIYI